MIAPIQDADENASEKVELSGRVDWFDPIKGYGFIQIPDRDEGVYIKDTVLLKSGFRTLLPGEKVDFYAILTSKGLSVVELKSVSPSSDVTTRERVSVVRVFRDRGYGFVRILGTDDDAFFHFSIVDEELQSKLVDGAVFSADIYRDDVKAGLEVRKLSGE